MKHWTRTDQLILAGASVLLAFFSYLLYDDSLLFPRRSADQLEKIGFVQKAENDVRLKSAKEFAWLPAQKEEAVHLMDSVFTGERSSTSLVIDDGTVLTLGENSLITLVMVDGQLQLDLRYGDITADLSPLAKMRISSGDKIFELQGSSRGRSGLRISKPSAGEVDLKLEKGAARIKTIHPDPNAQTQKLVKGQNVEINQDGKLETQEQVNLWLETPPGAKLYRVRDGEPIQFRWIAEGPPALFEVEICVETSCARPAMRKSAQRESLDLTDHLRDGTYHWRVRALDKIGKVMGLSETRQFTLYHRNPPRLIRPSVPHVIDRTVRIAMADEVVRAKTEIAWETDRRFTDYEWQVSPQADFVVLAAEGRSTEGRQQTPSLTNATYHYRVRGLFQTGEFSAWSETASFKIDLKTELVPRPLTPYFMLPKMVYDPVEEKRKNPNGTLGPVIRWSPSPTAVEYRVEIDTSKDFSAPLTYRVPTNAFHWTQYQHGDFFVRLTSIDRSGIESLRSQTGTLSVLTSGPRLAAFDRVVIRAPAGTLKPSPAELTARWLEVPKAGGYQVQWSLDPEFGDLQSANVKTNGARLPVSSPGRYYVRVRALDSRGDALTEFSNVQRGIYDFVVPRPSPTLVEPFDKASIFMQSTLKPFLWLEWKPVPDVPLYEIEIAYDEAFTRTFVKEKVSDSRYLIRQKVPTGSLYWRVRAVTENHELISEWSKSRRFTITN